MWQINVVSVFVLNDPPTHDCIIPLCAALSNLGSKPNRIQKLHKIASKTINVMSVVGGMYFLSSFHVSSFMCTNSKERNDSLQPTFFQPSNFIHFSLPKIFFLKSDLS